MGKPITVDSDDLEALLFSTGAIKALEAALVQAKDDPLVEQAKPRLTAAHDRLAADCRRGLRESGYPGSRDVLDEPIGKADAQVLFRFWRLPMGAYAASLADGLIPVLYGDKDVPRPRGYDGLHQRGMLEFGAIFEIILWGDSQERSRIDKPIQAVRLTEQGRQALSKLLRLVPAS